MGIVSTIFSVIALLLLSGILIYLIFFYLPQQKSADNQVLVQALKSNEELLKLRLDSLSNQQKETSQQQGQLLQFRLEQVEKELRNNKVDLSQQQKEINQQQEKLLKLHLCSLSEQQKESGKKQEELLKLRLDSLNQELKSSRENLSQINNLLLAPFERGRLGNIQLDRLLALYLPKNDQVYQLEYRMKKATGKGGFLIADAIIFGVDGKNNLAIDSKFPLENYLVTSQEGLTSVEKGERIKRFKENLKVHIKKVAEYISPVDDTHHVIMFIPSEVVFAKINEQSYYEIIEFALAKKVSLCSPVTLAIVVNQILWTNQIHEQYRTMDQVLAKLQNFWTDFARWQERWTKILDIVNKSNKALQEFNTSIEKIVKHGEKIKEIKTISPALKEAEVPNLLTKKTEEI